MLGLTLDVSQIGAFGRLVQELRAWNDRFNLTAITEPDEILVKHVLDSLTVLPTLDQLAKARAARIVDIGSGAGFPGIPLKIARPDFEITLVEASGKKAAFLNHVIEELGLREITAVAARAEDLGRGAVRESFDVAVARAVGGVATLAELMLPLIRVGGHAILMKTASGLNDERGEADADWDELGARVGQEIPVSIPGLLNDRVLLIAEKVAPTPARYPRRPGIPQRRPLVKR